MTRRALACCCALLVTSVLLGASAWAATRTVSMGLSASTVVTNQGVRVGGTVGSTGSGAPVELQTLTDGSWRTLVRSTTTSGGRYAISYTPGRSGRQLLRVVAPPHGSLSSATTRSLTLTVLRPSSATLSTPAVVTVGRTSTFIGRVVSAAVGSSVRLERWTGSAWELALSGTTRTDGRFELSHAGTVGTTRYRVVAPRQGLRSAATSPTVDAVVRSTAERVTTVHAVSGELRSTTGWESGDVVRLSGRVTVPDGVTVDVPARVTLASDGSALEVSGTLRLQSGVVLTSTGDPAVSSALRAAGSSTSATSWLGVSVVGRGQADLADAAIRRASAALVVAETASAAWHGSVTSVGWGLRGYGYVDARGVDWGDPSGPAPFGTGAGVNGVGAHVAPWRGYTATAPSSTSNSAGPLERCDDVVVLGARGSGEAPTGSQTYESVDHLGLGRVSLGVAHAAWQRVVEARPDLGVGLRPVRYPAYDVYGDSRSTRRWPVFLDSLDRGAAAVAAELRLLRDACPETVVVLVGSSQGAMVVRMGLRRLTVEERSAVAAVVMIGDPAREPGAPELQWSAGDSVATADDVATGGQLLLTQLLPGVDTSLPSDVLPATTSLCRVDDIFCTARRGSTLVGHLDYTWEQHLLPTGRRAGSQALDALSAREGARRDGL